MRVDTDEFPIGEDGICEACVDAEIAEWWPKDAPSIQAQLEAGGLDRDLMIELRQQFLAMTMGEEYERPGAHQ